MQSTAAIARNYSPRASAAYTGVRDERIKAHLHLVRSVARALRARGLGRNVDLEDLVAYGSEGLVEAACRFDGARGIPFGAFARIRISGAIIDGIREQHWFGRRACRHPRIDQAPADGPANDPGGTRQPVGVWIVHLDRTEAGGQEWPDEITEAGQVRSDARWNGRRMVQVPVGDGDNLQPLAAAIRLLPARERRLLDLCYFEGKTLSQAAKEMGFGCPWASRLHARALAALRVTIQKSIPLPTVAANRTETRNTRSIPCRRIAVASRDGNSTR